MIKETKLYQELKSRNTEKSNYYINKIDFMCRESAPFLERIVRVFRNYTKHDISHSRNVIEIMYELIEDNVNDLGELELTLLIMAAITHDLGMFATEEEIKEIKSDELIIGNRKYSKVLAKVGDEQIALEECIRPSHAKRSGEIINHVIKDNKKVLNAHNSESSYLSHLSKINESHNESLEWIKSTLENSVTLGRDTFNPQFIAIILRLSDWLDVDDLRTPYAIMDLLNLPSFSTQEWEKHLVISNQKKTQKINPKTDKKQIFFQGRSCDSKIHRELLKYFKSFEEELGRLIRHCSDSFDEKYHLNLDAFIDDKVSTIGFHISNLKFAINYKDIRELLMGENIYGSKEYGIRELMQNAIDACAVLEGFHGPTILPPSITIEWNEVKNKLIIRDTGIGMNEEILRKYFLNIGSSYYRSEEFLYSLEDNVKPIGNHGIGFLSTFMLSDDVFIKTKHFEDDQLIELALSRNSEYVELTRKKDPSFYHGTSIELTLDSVKKVFKDANSIRRFILKNFIDIKYKISIVEEVENEKRKETVVQVKNTEEYKDEQGWSNLSNYFEDIDVFVKYGDVQPKLYSSLMDLGENTIFIGVDNENNLRLYKPEDAGSLDDYIENDMLHYFEIPLIIGKNMREAISYSKIGKYMCKPIPYNEYSYFTYENADRNIENVAIIRLSKWFSKFPDLIENVDIVRLNDWLGKFPDLEVEWLFNEILFSFFDVLSTTVEQQRIKVFYKKETIIVYRNFYSGIEKEHYESYFRDRYGFVDHNYDQYFGDRYGTVFVGCSPAKGIISLQDIYSFYGGENNYRGWIPASERGINLVGKDKKYLRISDFNNFKRDTMNRYYELGLYVGGILVKGFRLNEKIAKHFPAIKIKGFVINCKHKNIVPDASRHNLKTELVDKISYAFWKSLLEDIEKTHESADVRSCIEIFKNKYFSESNEFLK